MSAGGKSAPDHAGERTSPRGHRRSRADGGTGRSPLGSTRRRCSSAPKPSPKRASTCSRTRARRGHRGRTRKGLRDSDRFVKIRRVRAAGGSSRRGRHPRCRARRYCSGADTWFASGAHHRAVHSVGRSTDAKSSPMVDGRAQLVRAATDRARSKPKRCSLLGGRSLPRSARSSADDRVTPKGGGRLMAVPTPSKTSTPRRPRSFGPEHAPRWRRRTNGPWKDAPIRRPTSAKEQVMHVDAASSRRRPDRFGRRRTDGDPSARTRRERTVRRSSSRCARPATTSSLRSGLCVTEGVIANPTMSGRVAHCVGPDGDQQFNVVTLRLRHPIVSLAAPAGRRLHVELRAVRPDRARRRRGALRRGRTRAPRVPAS